MTKSIKTPPPKFNISDLDNLTPAQHRRLRELIEEWIKATVDRRAAIEMKVASIRQQGDQQ